MIRSKADFIETIRLRCIPVLGKLVHFVNEVTNCDIYVEGPTSANQFVGRVPLSEEEFEDVLTNLNFQRNPLAALKRLARTKEREEGSFRWLSDGHDEYRDDFQLHVVLFDGKLVPDAQTGETFVYAHWEYRWDVAPIKHYRAEEFQPEKGVRMMQKMLDAHDIPYDQTRPVAE